MKISIIYSSRTGNTEKIANSLKEGLGDCDVKILNVKDADPSTLYNYDIVFLGSGIYAGKVDKSIIDFIKKVENMPAKFVLFCTHSSIDAYQNGFKTIKRKIDEKKIIGEWDSRGENLGISMDAQMKMIERLPLEKQEQAKKFIEDSRGRPNDEDLENAKNFAKSIIN